MPVNFFRFLDNNDFMRGFEPVEGSLSEVKGDAFAGELVVWRKSKSEPVLKAGSLSGIFAAIVVNFSAGVMEYETAVAMMTALEKDLPKKFYNEHANEIEKILTPEDYRTFVENNYSFSI